MFEKDTFLTGVYCPMYCFHLHWSKLIYDVVLVSGVQQSDSVIHTYLFKFFSHLGSVVPCAMQQVLAGYLS